MYDANKNFIERKQYDISGTVFEGSIFNGATYVRVSYRTYMFNRPVFAACGVRCEAMDEQTIKDNLLETYPMIFNGYVTQNGAVIGTTHDINGYIPSEHNELTSDFIPCEGNKEMFIYANAPSDNFIRIAFYGADGYCISTFAYSPTSVDGVEVKDYNNFLETFVTPENAVAIRISCRWKYLTECVLAYKDEQRRYLYRECERKYNSNIVPEETTDIVMQAPIETLVKAVAHRGLSAYAPENTLSAYRLAAKHGFKYVECDVSFTADDVPVLLHDSTIDRTSNGTGNISTMTYDEAVKYDYGSWFSLDYAGEKIPTFNEFISLCRRLSLHPYIEIKSGTQLQIATLVRIVASCGMQDKVTWISFNLESLRIVKEEYSAARLGYVVSEINLDILSEVKRTLQSDENEVFIDTGSMKGIDYAMVDSIPVEVWTIDDKNTILNMHEYISGVTSNYTHAGKVLYESEILK